MSTPITIKARVSASPEAAWRAYTDPDAITCWNFATPEWCCPRAEVDLRPGGRHFARMEARDGSMGFDFAAAYTIVDAPHTLEMRLDDGRMVRTTFAADGEGTDVQTVFDADPTHPVEMQRDGWQAILENYASYATETSQ